MSNRELRDELARHLYGDLFDNLRPWYQERVDCIIGIVQRHTRVAGVNVHNHGPEEGPGLACCERLVGQCQVVIDPEDREQVERLSKLYEDEPMVDVPDPQVVELQAALRKFADPKPPKPEEPTKLGAIVKDSQGDHWQLDGDHPDLMWWGLGSRDCRAYRDIDVVEIVFEGVR